MIKTQQTRNSEELFLRLVSGIYKYPTVNVLVNSEMLKSSAYEINNEPTMSAVIPFIEHCTECPSHCRSTRIKETRFLM